MVACSLQVCSLCPSEYLVWTWNRKGVCQVDSKLKHLAILGHSWGLASSAPEGPHSQTAGSPRKIREIRFAAKVLGTTEVMEWCVRIRVPGPEEAEEDKNDREEVAEEELEKDVQGVHCVSGPKR